MVICTNIISDCIETETVLIVAVGGEGAVTGAVGHRIKTGSWEGAGEAALNGAADGYMMGAITGFISGGLGNVAQGKCFVAGTTINCWKGRNHYGIKGRCAYTSPSR